MRIRTIVAAATTASLISMGGLALAAPSQGTSQPRTAHGVAGTRVDHRPGAPWGTKAGLTRGDRKDLQRWAKDTWASFVAMTDEATGLPADNIDADLSAGSRSGYTSPTNIGAYLWSTVVAKKLGIIGSREARARMAQTLATTAGLERHEPSGMLFNWYDEATGEKLDEFPDGEQIFPFVSSVDNGWFAAALMVVRTAEPKLRAQAQAQLDLMDFGSFYDAEQFDGERPGMLRGGFWVDPPAPDQCAEEGEWNGATVLFTCHHYDLLNSEPRIASYIGIAHGQIPREHYFATHRTFPASCDWDWLEQRPVGKTRTYLGQEVFEGAFTYRGMRIVPTWGGSMFEELMPDLFVPEARWGKHSWAINHPLAVRAHIEHGLDEAGYGYWGFSPASDPFGSYGVYGVDEIGMDPGGYPSDREHTDVDRGYEGCREATNPEPEFGDGVVTPHAAFLALPYAPRAAVDNLRGIETDLGAYGPGGFYDAVAVRSNTQAQRHLALDQGMIMGALGNVLGKDVLRKAFSKGAVERTVRPLLAKERFSVGYTRDRALYTGRGKS